MKNNQASGKEVLKAIGTKNIIASLIILIFAMIIISINFGILYKTKKDNIIDENKHKAVESSQAIDNYLLTSLDTIKMAAYKVDYYISKGKSSDEILTYLTEESDVIISVIDKNYTGLYGYINGEYLDGSGWVPDADYVPTARPWYIEAVDAGGDIVLVDPYLDSQTGTIMMTIGKLLSDNESVLALDLSLEDLETITLDVPERSTDFAMVLDSKGGVVSHSNPEELGKNYLNQVNTLESAIAENIFNSHKTQFELKFDGTTYIIFTKKIQNDWYCISVINGTEIFKPLKIILLISLLVIVLFAFVILLILYNISSKHIVANKLNQQLESMSHIYMSMYDIDLVTNTFSEISNSSSHVTSLLGDTHENAKENLHCVMEVLSSERSRKDLLEFVDLNTIEERLANSNTITMEYINDKDLWCRGRFVVAERNENDKPVRVLWMVELIDEEKRRQERLQYLSDTDRMTGINNRGSGEKKIKEFLADGQGGMFVLLDVDKFKSINDTFGHSVGDQVLITLAMCLQKAFRANDIIMRLGGDEFAVYVPDVHNKNAGERIIQRLISVIDDTNVPELNGRKFYISIGVSFYQHDDTFAFEELYKRADSCTYISKKFEGNYASYYETDN
ncbi:MAG: diguanylate cyclase [Lachnospiraceae bacterium]|nr:diguanylate cyclase [Lachnospiraceae bacterium]MBQ9233136.1 diguanylate cyclase [Lachnospiraceae bacterium]